MTSFLRPLALGDWRTRDWDAGAHILFLCGMLAAASTRRELYHQAVALGFVVRFVVLLSAYAFVPLARLR